MSDAITLEPVGDGTYKAVLESGLVVGLVEPAGDRWRVTHPSGYPMDLFDTSYSSLDSALLLVKIHWHDAGRRV